MTANLIVFIAPPGIDTDAIAENLGLPVYSPYDYSDEEWSALGYDASADTAAWASGGAYASYRLLAQVRLNAIQKMLAETQTGVIVLPPDFTVHENPADHARLVSLLSPPAQVIALMPTPDTAENARLLDADLSTTPDWGAVNAYWIENPSNERLATHVVYTRGKSAEQTRDEILNLTRDSREIVLIGPKLTGKTTVGRLLADALGVRQISLDTEGRNYLGETDYDPAKRVSAFKSGGIFEQLRYMRPYEAHIVERILADTRNAVIDFGGGHSVYEDEAHFKRVQHALAPFAHVVLILPSPDKQESIAILRQRFEADLASEQRVQRPLVSCDYSALASHTIYTHGRTQADITEAVLRVI